MASYQLETIIINKEISFQGSPRCLSLDPFDPITLTHSKPGWTDQLLRVISASWNNAGFANVVCVEEDEIFYDDVFDVEAHNFHNTNTASPLDPVPSVIDVSMTEEVYDYRGRSFTRLKVNFSPPIAADYPYWSYANIYCKITAAGEWKFMTKAISSYEIDPVQEKVEYFIRIQSVSMWGTKQNIDAAYIVSKNVQGKVALPTSLSSLSAIANGDTVTLMAFGVDDPDISGYEFRIGTSWGQGIFIGFTLHPSLRLVGVRPGTFTFVANVKDNAGNYGATPRSAQVTVFYPANYTDKNTWAWDFTTGTFSNTEHCTTSGEDALKCSHTADVLTGTWTSPEYDLGSVKTVRVWGDFRVDMVDSSQEWSGALAAGKTWTELGLALKKWYEIFASTVASQLKATVYWGTSPGSLTNSADFFEICSAEFSAQYVQVVVEITDPALDANLKLKTLNMKAAYVAVTGGNAASVF